MNYHALDRYVLAIHLLLFVSFPSAQAQPNSNILSQQRLLDQVRHGIIKVESIGGPDVPCRSEATGFIVAIEQRSALVVTAKHALPDQAECRKSGVKLYGRPPWESEKLQPLKLLKDSPIDLALYRMPLPKGKLAQAPCALPIGNVLKPIANVVFFGYFPGDVDQALPHAGRIDSNPIAGAGAQRILGPVLPGTSGGPVFDDAGSIVGLVKERMTKDQSGNDIFGVGWIVPSNNLTSTFAEYLKGAARGKRLCGAPDPFDAVSEIENLGLAIEVLYHLSDLRSDYDPLSPSDAAKWLLGGAREQIRYPKSYSQRFSAPKGYVFESVSGTSIISHNLPSEPAPTAKCQSKEDCIWFDDEGRTMVVNYRLWSGPRGLDETRGWLDMVIKAKLSRKFSSATEERPK